MNRCCYLFLAVGLTLAASGVRAAPQDTPVTQPAQAMRQSSETAARLAQARKQAAAIKPGTSRAQVGKVFRREDGGLMGPDVTRYYVGAGVMVDVPFDQFGGAWGPRNRVRRALKVYRSPFHSD